jgi:hypothetical protein
VDSERGQNAVLEAAVGYLTNGITTVMDKTICLKSNNPGAMIIN